MFNIVIQFLHTHNFLSMGGNGLSRKPTITRAKHRPTLNAYLSYPWTTLTFIHSKWYQRFSLNYMYEFDKSVTSCKVEMVPKRKISTFMSHKLDKQDVTEWLNKMQLMTLIINRTTFILVVDFQYDWVVSKRYSWGEKKST